MVECQGQLTTKVTCHSNPWRLGTVGRDNTHTHSVDRKAGDRAAMQYFQLLLLLSIYLDRV